MLVCSSDLNTHLTARHFGRILDSRRDTRSLRFITLKMISLLRDRLVLHERLERLSEVQRGELKADPGPREYSPLPKILHRRRTLHRRPQSVP